MKRYPKAENTEIEIAAASTDANQGAFDVAKELEHCEEILRREVRNLLSESSRGKLSTSSSVSLQNYIKLLSDMREEQQEKLKTKNTEELEKLAKD